MQKESYKVELPYPPSVNHYWQRTRFGTLCVSNRGKQFRAEVKKAVVESSATMPAEMIMYAVDVFILVFPPDRRTRDIDNLLKAVLDALTFAGVWYDDKQVRKLTIERSSTIKKGGSVFVDIKQYQGEVL